MKHQPVWADRLLRNATRVDALCQFEGRADRADDARLTLQPGSSVVALSSADLQRFLVKGFGFGVLAGLIV